VKKTRGRKSRATVPLSNVSDPHRFYADHDSGLASYVNADPDPAMNMNIRINADPNQGLTVKKIFSQS
jgi:hypothetical protein